MIVGSTLNEDDLRPRLAEIGDSLLVVGDRGLVRVHIHTDDPGRALSFATTIGRLHQVKVQDMQAQHEEFATEVVGPAPSKDDSASIHAGDVLPIGVVAVAIGSGFSETFKSLGATVVPGGQSMNPSTQQVLTAIHSCAQDRVIVLPNNANVLFTAQQAAALSEKSVQVLPSQTMPQGIAALLAVRYDEEPDEILTTMRDAVERVRTIEITTAVRDAELDGLQVRSGDVLGLVDGKLAGAGTDVASVVTELLETMPINTYELLTIYRGRHVTGDQAEALQATLERRYPKLAIELHDGGQPHYQFILSIE
jgi:dihydroxyacetone kinase-like predicted kinase